MMPAARMATGSPIALVRRARTRSEGNSLTDFAEAALVVLRAGLRRGFMYATVGRCQRQQQD